MKTCSICNKEVQDGVYNVKQNFVCRLCKDSYPNLYIDDFKYENKKVVGADPLSGKTDDECREIFVQYTYTLYNNHIAPRVFSQIKQFRKKGYTWTGMIRALEWFYIVKHNDIAKSNYSIGIIPYVYSDAQKYYDSLNIGIQRKYETQLIKESSEIIQIEVQSTKKKNLIDVEGL